MREEEGQEKEKADKKRKTGNTKWIKKESLQGVIKKGTEGIA